MTNFVHLHVHSAYSLLDGAGRIEEIVLAAKKQGMPAVALTDHGVMYGCVDFYKAALAHDIKPLLGCEVYVAPRTRHDFTPRVDDRLNHLVLLAENERGYKNLMSLVSRAFLEGFYYKPRVDKELLAQHKEGLIALSGCLAGEVPERLLANDEVGAIEAASIYREIFGPENFFLELQDQNLPQQPALNRNLLSLARKLGLEVVATNDVHYTNREDAVYHDLLLCIQTGKNVHDEERLRFPTDEFYFKSELEMARMFSDIPQALTNTRLIADRCQVKLELGQIHLPSFPLPANYTARTYLEKLCRDGLIRRFGRVTRELEERLLYELNVIHKMGYSSYFLIVWDFVRFARSHGILVGPGRGSAAGSLVAYTLGITDIDPLAHGLLFERFLNPERISMPDIDIDFADNRRDEVIEYVAATYGTDHVAQIITFGTMAARAAIRDVGRAYDLSYNDVDRIAKLVPGEPGVTLATALTSNQELAHLYEEEDWVRRLIDGARKLEGLPRHASTHAAGVVISARPLVDYVPLQKIGDGVVTTQYPWETIEEIGLLKMDFLGLRTLSVIQETKRLVEENRGHKLDLSSLSLDDPAAYELLSSGHTFGVFQLESSGMRALIRELKPTGINDLTALVALYRPGPLGSGMAEDFIARRHGQKKVEYLHPELESILKETYGVILYQEQVMQIASRLAGFTLGQADLLRRAMGKKKPEALAAQRERFLTGARQQGITTDVAGRVFDLMEYFAGYGFNKSHSAAYAMLAYETAYLKANYKAEFMAALMTSVMDDTDKVALYAEECRRMGLSVLPPDVNFSGVNFSVDEGQIRFGLAAIKNAGRAAMRNIIATREDKGPFRSLADLCQRVDLKSINKRTLENLIKAGATGSLNGNRAQQLAILDKVVEEAQAYQRQQVGGQGLLWESLPITVMETPLPNLPEVAAETKLSWEKETLGLYLSGHPLTENAHLLEPIVTVRSSELAELLPETPVVMGGIVTGLKQITTRKGQPMAFVTVEDLTGSFEAVVFPRVFVGCSWLKRDSLVVLTGRAAGNEDESPKVLVNSLLPLAATQELYLRIKEPSVVSLVQAELAAFPGESPVLLFFAADKRLLRLSQDYNVRLDDKLLFRLQDLLGKGSVAIKAKKML